jgi:hypothetical protein
MKICSSATLTQITGFPEEPSAENEAVEVIFVALDLSIKQFNKIPYNN